MVVLRVPGFDQLSVVNGVEPTKGEKGQNTM